MLANITDLGLKIAILAGLIIITCRILIWLWSFLKEVINPETNNISMQKSSDDEKEKSTEEEPESTIYTEETLSEENDSITPEVTSTESEKDSEIFTKE